VVEDEVVTRDQNGRMYFYCFMPDGILVLHIELCGKMEILAFKIEWVLDRKIDNWIIWREGY